MTLEFHISMNQLLLGLQKESKCVISDFLQEKCLKARYFSQCKNITIFKFGMLISRTV